MITHTLGFPRIGKHRELKKAVEAYWKKTISENELQQTAAELRKQHWQWQKEAGLDLIPVGDFSFYDSMLDMIATLGALPSRFGSSGENGVGLEQLFRMARGGAEHAAGCSCGCSARPASAMEMTKWFDTNYHYIVPELDSDQTFRLSSDKLVKELTEAKGVGVLAESAKAVMPGPITFLSLAKGENRWKHADEIAGVYANLLESCAGLCGWVQLDEPVLVTDLEAEAQAAFLPVYARIAEAAKRVGIKLMVATYFGALNDNAELACKLPVDGLHIDLCRGADQLDNLLQMIPDAMVLSLGLVDGRNIWRARIDDAAVTVKKAVARLGEERVWIGSSCSLQHVPVDLEEEKKLDPTIRSWMAYAKQKCREIKLVADAAGGYADEEELAQNRAAHRSRATHEAVVCQAVRDRIAAVTPEMAKRASAYPERKKAQQSWLKLPLLPTTTIGSFPQTAELRKTRSKFRSGELSAAQYDDELKTYIDDVIAKQETLGLDVFVHGEPERTDMVEYFGMQMDGFCFTENGWVQSYGSRCVKPPVIYGDVSRPKPMTVDWIKYAESKTKKPMKGMLTGPVTILCWSFVRDDLTREEVCRQLALAVRDEVADLAEAGIKMIQIDEAALREGLPLRKNEWNAYLSWAVESFRIATSGIGNDVQIHTHMCYSEFNQIAEWIAKMDADVISIEASRSKMELLDAFKEFAYPNEIGPGVYDIHSPRVPSVEEMVQLLEKALEVIPPERLWVNPDCGLKTRAWPETLESLKNMVVAAAQVRERLSVCK